MFILGPPPSGGTANLYWARFPAVRSVAPAAKHETGNQTKTGGHRASQQNLSRAFCINAMPACIVKRHRRQSEDYEEATQRTHAVCATPLMALQAGPASAPRCRLALPLPLPRSSQETTVHEGHREHTKQSCSLAKLCKKMLVVKQWLDRAAILKLSSDLFGGRPLGALRKLWVQPSPGIHVTTAHGQASSRRDILEANLHCRVKSCCVHGLKGCIASACCSRSNLPLRG